MAPQRYWGHGFDLLGSRDVIGHGKKDVKREKERARGRERQGKGKVER